MSIKSEMAAMGYLSRLKPRKYKLDSSFGKMVLKENVLAITGGFIWVTLHIIKLGKQL